MNSKLPFLAPVFRRPWILCLSLPLALAAGWAYLQTAETKYQSTAQILVMQKDTRLTSEVVEAGLDTSIQSEILGTHLQILVSPKIIRKAIKQQDLLQLESLLEQARKPSGIAGFLPLPAERTGPATDEDLGPAVEYLRQNMKVRRGGADAARDAQIVEVALQHYSSGEDGAEILRAIVESYRTFLQDMASRMGQEAKTAISQARDELQDVVRTNEAEREKFLVQSPLIWHNGVASNPHERQMVELETEMTNLGIRRAAAVARLEDVGDALENEPDASLELLALIDEADIERLGLLMEIEKGGLPASAATEFGKLVELRVELERKLSIYKANHPSVVQLRNTVKELEKFLLANTRSLKSLREDDGVDPRRIVEVYKRLLGQDIADIDSRQQAVTELIADHSAKAKTLSTYEVRYDQINRKLERSQDIYDTVLQRLRQVDVTKDFGGFITDELSPVEVGYQVWPRPKFVYLLCGLLGLGGGWVIALFAEYMDQSFRNKMDVEMELDLPLLGQIPLIRFRRRRKSKGVTPAHCSVSTLHFPDSRFAEAYRGIRTALVFRTGTVEHPVVQVTSPHPGDGKSTLVANLAVSMARASKRVLVLDCDLRKPSLHRLFGLSNELGLTSALRGLPIESVTHSTELPNLKVIPSGPIPADPAEVLVSPDFKQFLAVAREEFDYVLMDSPPVMGASDALAIASDVDYTLLVVRLMRDSRYSAKRALNELVCHGAGVVGVVSNGELRETTPYQYRSNMSDLRVVAKETTPSTTPEHALRRAK